MIESNPSIQEPPSPLPGWSFIVCAAEAGLRLDAYLCQRIPRISRARAARLAVIDLDAPERRLKKSSIVRTHQRLWVRRPVPDADAVLIAPEIIYEDQKLLVLNKPAGLAVHPTAARYRSTVTHWLAHNRRGQRVEPVHRLDVETSGVLLCGKGLEAVRVLRRTFAEGHLEKTYLAVTEGVCARSEWTTDTPLGFDETSAIRLKMGPGRLEARTDFRVKAQDSKRALVEALPRTGRQHQIRVHAALSGHPVVGDKLYGPDDALFLAHLERPLSSTELERLGAPRHALHATRLEFDFLGDRHRFEAPWPSLFTSLIENV